VTGLPKENIIFVRTVDGSEPLPQPDRWSYGQLIESSYEQLRIGCFRPTGKGVACQKLGISHFVDDKIEVGPQICYSVWLCVTLRVPKYLARSLLMLYVLLKVVF